MDKKRKIIIGLILTVIVFIVALLAFMLINNKTEEKNEVEVNQTVKLKELPKPEISGGARGELGIDKNINESTIDEYLNREDSVYRDMRMLEDPGNYESIGGDRFLSGYIKGFEVIPLPYIIPVEGLPSEVGNTYRGTTLFYNNNGTYVANYEESMDIIEKLFPKDKVIFLMCGGGGYAGMTKNFLVSMGWDENKIYNVGGFWNYKGKNSINVKKEVNGVVSYDFEKVPYHNIEFEKLTKAKEYKEAEIKVSELKINTSKIEIEEGLSFQLNVIVLPNDATNKELRWESSNESIAKVTDEGIVKAISEGTATITVESVDGKHRITSKIIVTKRLIDPIILDDVFEEARKFALYDPEKIFDDFHKLAEDSNGMPKPEYCIEPAELGYGCSTNDLWREKYNEAEQKAEEAIKIRTNIFNKLIDENKTFIILVYTKDCEGREYTVSDGAEKILKENNYPYFYTNEEISGYDRSIVESKLDTQKVSAGSIVFIKEGKYYAGLNVNEYSIKNDEETKNWLRKYINIK